VTINFAVADIPLSCRFLVSDAIDEPTLGIDWLERNNCAWDFTRRSLIILGREVLLVRQENWEPAVCLESNCAAVITRRQAREHARNGNEVDPSVGGGDVDLPFGGEVINMLLDGEIADLSLDVEEPSQIGSASL